VKLSGIVTKKHEKKLHIHTCHDVKQHSTVKLLINLNHTMEK